MKFNQTVWDALVWAKRQGYPFGFRALEEYAHSCGGKVQTVREATVYGHNFEFIPNPIPKY